MNAGAAFFVVTVHALVSNISYNVLTWVAFFGAAVAVAVVYGLGSLGRDGMTPIKITLAGSAMTAFFSSLTQGIQLTSGKAFEQTLFWLVGSVADRELSMLVITSYSIHYTKLYDTLIMVPLMIQTMTG